MTHSAVLIEHRLVTDRHRAITNHVGIHTPRYTYMRCVVQ